MYAPRIIKEMIYISTLSENINRAILDFGGIKAALQNRGVTVADGTPTSEYAKLVAKIPSQPIYGVSGLFDESTELTRTDDAVSLGYSLNSADGSVTSDFNSVFPWNEAEIITNSEGKFIKMPRMFFRIGRDSSNRLTDAAVSKAPSFCGSWFEVKPFLYACYGGSERSSRLVSVSSAQRKAYLTRADARVLCSNNGEGYCQLDLYHRTVMTLLFFIEFATKKSDSIMSGRIMIENEAESPCLTGGTDLVSTPSGWNTQTGQMRYHYIEDFYGNLREFLDGVVFTGSNAGIYVTDNPSLFSDSAENLAQLAWNAPAQGYLAALGWDNSHPFCCAPIQTTDRSNYTKYFCDEFCIQENKPALLCGSVYDSRYANYGLTHMYTLSALGKFENSGARLIKILE